MVYKQQVKRAAAPQSKRDPSLQLTIANQQPCGSVAANYSGARGRPMAALRRATDRKRRFKSARTDNADKMICNGQKVVAVGWRKFLSRLLAVSAAFTSLASCQKLSDTLTTRQIKCLVLFFMTKQTLHFCPTANDVSRSRRVSPDRASCRRSEF